MLLENSLKKFKETSEEFKKMFGLIGLTIIIIFSFMILNIFFGASDKSTEGSKTGESNETVIASLPKGRLNFFEGSVKKIKSSVIKNLVITDTIDNGEKTKSVKRT